jgi:hypothetical protein
MAFFAYVSVMLMSHGLVALQHIGLTFNAFFAAIGRRDRRYVRGHLKGYPLE